MRWRSAILTTLLAVLHAAAADPAHGGESAATATSSAPDPYAWLDDQYAPAAVQWAKARRDRAVADLEAQPEFAAVQHELQTALKRDAGLPELFVLGKRLVRFVRDTQHPSGLLQVAPRSARMEPLAWRTVLDLAALNSKEGTSYALNGLSFSDFPNRCLSPAYSRCLLPLSPGGSSNLELREFDLDRGAFVADGFRVPANRDFTAWLNFQTLVIAHSLEGSPTLNSSFPAIVRIWRRGQPLRDARPIFRADATDSLVDMRSVGGGSKRKVLLSIARDYSTVDFKLVDPSGRLTPIELPRQVKYVGNVAISAPYIAVQLAQPADVGGKHYAAEAIIAYDTDSGIAPADRYSEIYSPADGGFVNDGYSGFSGTRSGFEFVEERSLHKTLLTARRGPRGWVVSKTVVAPPGVTLKILSATAADDDLLLEEEGFLKPPTVSLVRPKQPPTVIATAQPVIDAEQYVTEIRSAVSKDGTHVDYYLVHPKSARPGPAPALIGGYGSFGLNYEPSYFSSELKLGMLSWLTRGGVFAAAAIRGGGERGEAWHLDGAGSKKQHSFDDFIAVAEDLIHSGVTRRQSLGAFGRSGGGLLTAVMTTQRPDLFAALLIGVPVTDLVRLGAHGSGIVQGQKAEFGDWDDPKQLPGILAYSPYQNIRPGVEYPRTLIITSTEDNQVGPGQARRFAARLEEVGARPLFIEEPTGGHGVPDQIKQPDLVAAEMTFFIHTLMN